MGIAAYRVVQLALDAVGEKENTHGQHAVIRAASKLMNAKTCVGLVNEIASIDTRFALATKRAHDVIDAARKQRDKEYESLVEKVRKEWNDG